MKLRNNLTKIFLFFRPLWKSIVAQLVILISLALVAVAWPYYFGKIIDGVTSGASFDEISKYLLFMSISLLGTSVFVMLRNVNETKFIHLQAENLLKQISINKMTELSVGQHTRSDSGFKQSALDQGSNAVQQVFFSINYDILPTLIRYIGFSTAVTLISPLIGIVSIGISAFQFFLYQRLNISHIDKWRKWRENSLEFGRWNSEIIRMITQVIFRGASKEVSKSQKNKIDVLQKEFEKTWLPYDIKASLIQVLGDINLILVVTIGVLSITSWNVLTVGAVVSILTYANKMIGNIEGIYGTFRRLSMTWPQVEKFFDILDLENDVKEIKNPKKLEAVEGGFSINFENITFSHTEFDEIKDDKTQEKVKHKMKALDDVSFEISAGEVCAIVGRSGAGKTTIINLLLRAFDPDHGKIKINEIELKKLSLENYRRKVGIVEQDVILQNTSLKDNILFGLSDEEKEKWNDDKLKKLAKITRIDQFFDRLGENPFNAVVGERGIKLSGGQRQRVGIARALAVDPAILIFDEATSSLDGENEKAIHDAMKDAFKGRTVIVIAHRLSTVRHADKIICVESGKIAGIGNHDELYENCDPYKTLVDIQSE
jgi:ATP-binding cassette subfamily B protein